VAVSPRGVRDIVDEFVGDVSERGTVVAVGLLGDLFFEASGAEAIDVLIVGRSGRGFESHELVERGGFLLDLNTVPWGWVEGVVKPEVDHRLRRTRVVYDPTGVLERAREFVLGSYRSAGRVEIRTEGGLSTAEMYLSRASSAVNRGDLETALIYADAGLEHAGSVLMDVAGVPLVQEEFVWGLRSACEALEVMGFCGDFLGAARLSALGRREATECLEWFKGAWRGISEYVNGRRGVVAGLHEMLVGELMYLISPALLDLVVSRAGRMIDWGGFADAVVCLRGWLRRLLECYGWVVSAGRGDKFDYTSLFWTVGGVEGGERVYDDAVGVFGLWDQDRGGVEGSVEGARSLVSWVRSARRGLIEEFVRGGASG
jgi:hypothetical protein